MCVRVQHSSQKDEHGGDPKGLHLCVWYTCSVCLCVCARVCMSARARAWQWCMCMREPMYMHMVMAVCAHAHSGVDGVHVHETTPATGNTYRSGRSCVTCMKFGLSAPMNELPTRHSTSCKKARCVRVCARARVPLKMDLCACICEHVRASAVCESTCVQLCMHLCVHMCVSVVRVHAFTLQCYMPACPPTLVSTSKYGRYLRTL